MPTGPEGSGCSGDGVCDGRTMVRERGQVGAGIAAIRAMAVSNAPRQGQLVGARSLSRRAELIRLQPGVGHQVVLVEGGFDPSEVVP